MTMELQGYAPVVENKIYIRADKVKATIVEDGVVKEERESPIQRVLILGRYSQPTEDDVVAYLKEKAGEPTQRIRLALPTGVDIGTDKTPLEKLLLQLPEHVLGHLKIGKEDLLGLLKSDTTAPRADAERAHAQYVRVRYGIVPEEIVRDNSEALAASPNGFYEAALESENLRKIGAGERWMMNICLSPSDGRNVLPAKAEMEVLLKHGTSESKTLTITRRSYSREEVSGVLDALYGVLTTVENIGSLPDILSDVREMHAIEAIVGLHKHLQQQQIAAAMGRQRGAASRPSGL